MSSVSPGERDYETLVVQLELPNQHDAGEEQQAEIEHSIESEIGHRREHRQGGVAVRQVSLSGLGGDD